MASTQGRPGHSAPSGAIPITPWRGFLYAKDGRLVCRVESSDNTIRLAPQMAISKHSSMMEFMDLETLPTFTITVQQGDAADRHKEWFNFSQFLLNHTRVAITQTSRYELLLLCDTQPVRPGANGYAPGTAGQLRVYYAPLPKGIPRRAGALSRSSSREIPAAAQTGPGGVHPAHLESVAHAHSPWAFGALAELIDNARDANASRLEISIESGEQSVVAAEQRERSSESSVEEEEGAGGGAGAGGSTVQTVPMLCVSDNGSGMTHEDVVKMLSFGHDEEKGDNGQRIGRFGVGFKSGSMRLGEDVVVLTQSAESRTIAFLSRTFNRGKKILDIPIITYRKRQGGGMALDTRACSPHQERDGLRTIASLTPFDQFRIGEEFSKLELMAVDVSTGPSGATRVVEDASDSVEDTEPGGLPLPPRGLSGSGGGRGGTGTRIFIMGLQKQKGTYELDWDSDQTNILIRSKRARLRPNQLTSDIPVDYDLREYLKYLFMPPVDPDEPDHKKNNLRAAGPRMDVILRGTKAETGVDFLGPEGVACAKRAFQWPRLGRSEEHPNGQLFAIRLGFSPSEKAKGRCGIFLYWRGRLIEAYRKVGYLEHGDKCLGLVGVADTTLVLSGSKGGGVLNDKQHFLESEQFQEAMDELKKKVEMWWDKHFDREATGVVDPSTLDAPLGDFQHWANCNQCHKWRRLPRGVPAPKEEDEWFCYKQNRQCSEPEDQADEEELTTALNRNGRVVGQLISEAEQVPKPEAAEESRDGQGQAASTVPGRTSGNGVGATTSRGGQGPSGTRTSVLGKRALTVPVVKQEAEEFRPDGSRVKQFRSLKDV